MKIRYEYINLGEVEESKMDEYLALARMSNSIESGLLKKGNRASLQLDFWEMSKKFYSFDEVTYKSFKECTFFIDLVEDGGVKLKTDVHVNKNSNEWYDDAIVKYEEDLTVLDGSKEKELTYHFYVCGNLIVFKLILEFGRVELELKDVKFWNVVYKECQYKNDLRKEYDLHHNICKKYNIRYDRYHNFYQVASTVNDYSESLEDIKDWLGCDDAMLIVKAGYELIKESLN